MLPGDWTAHRRDDGVVKVDDFGDMQRPPAQQFTLPWPAPALLRATRPGDPDGRTLSR